MKDYRELAWLMERTIRQVGNIDNDKRPGAAAMVLLILYYIIIRIPAAYFLCNTADLNGIWIAFLLSHVMACVIAGFMTVQLSRNRCTKKVLQLSDQ